MEDKSSEMCVFVMMVFMMLAAAVTMVVLVIHAFKSINLCCFCYDTCAYCCYVYIGSHTACCVACVTS
jgi:hypothetical protein